MTTIKLSGTDPHEILSPAVVVMAQFQTIIQIHDETLTAITEMETYDDLGMAENSDPRFVGELKQRRQVMSNLRSSLRDKMSTDINEVRKRLLDLSGALTNHRELLSELAKIEGAFIILVEADEFSEDGEGSRSHYESTLSSLRNQVRTSTLNIIRILQEAGAPISTLVGANNGEQS